MSEGSSDGGGGTGGGLSSLGAGSCANTVQLGRSTASIMNAMKKCLSGIFFMMPFLPTSELTLFTESIGIRKETIINLGREASGSVWDFEAQRSNSIGW